MTILVRAGGLAGYCEFTRSLGLDPVKMLAAADLTEQDIADPNTYIPYTKLLEAMEQPAIPPPMMTTSAREGRALDITVFLQHQDRAGHDQGTVPAG